MKTYKYIFVSPNNGHYKTYQVFTTIKPLSQEQANEFMLSHPGAKRTGVGIIKLKETANKHGFDIKYDKTKVNDLTNRINADEKYDGIIEGISGNY
jgi:LAS superfamily LD-carboxypeptidase LdcB